MKPLFLLLLPVAALSAFGGGVPRASLAPIALYTKFTQAPPPAVESALHDELESIMAPIGMRFDWHSLSSVKGNEISVELAVINFKGHCDVAGLMPRMENPGALGWTHISDGSILPFSDIDCDGIRGFIQKDLLAVHAEDREEAFGRALGRVLAHELYHIFANTQHHGSYGVGKAAYTARELLSSDFVFEARESQALRNGKAHEVLEIAAQNSTME